MAPRCTPYAGVIAIWCVPTDKLKPAVWGCLASADATHGQKSRRFRCQRLHYVYQLPCQTKVPTKLLISLPILFLLDAFMPVMRSKFGRTDIKTAQTK
jgi:hypothetical protein